MEGGSTRDWQKSNGTTCRSHVSRGPLLERHVAHLRHDGNRVDVELGKLDGPIRISGSCTWDHRSELRSTEQQNTLSNFHRKWPNSNGQFASTTVTIAAGSALPCRAATS